MALSFDLEIGQEVTVAEGCKLRVEKKAGRRVRLIIDTKSDVSVGSPPPSTTEPASIARNLNGVLTRRQIPV